MSCLCNLVIGRVILCSSQEGFKLIDKFKYTTQNYNIINSRLWLQHNISCLLWYTVYHIMIMIVQWTKSINSNKTQYHVGPSAGLHTDGIFLIGGNFIFFFIRRNNSFEIWDDLFKRSLSCPQVTVADSVHGAVKQDCVTLTREDVSESDGGLDWVDDKKIIFQDTLLEYGLSVSSYNSVFSSINLSSLTHGSPLCSWLSLNIDIQKVAFKVSHILVWRYKCDTFSWLESGSETLCCIVTLITRR